MFDVVKGLDRHYSKKIPANGMVLVIPFKNEPKMHMIFGKSAVDFPVMMGILSWLKKRLQFSSGLNWNFFPGIDRNT
jgi:hypothetical protein